MQDVNSQLWTGDRRARRKCFCDSVDACARVGRPGEIESDGAPDGSIMPQPGLITLVNNLRGRKAVF